MEAISGDISLFMFLLISAIGGLSLIVGIMYIVGSIRTKDKSPAYIGIALICVCILSLLYLIF